MNKGDYKLILTVTMNPSVDIRYEMDQLNIDTTNRVPVAHKTAGGKGMNVARVIALSGRKAAATGIIGGTLGDFISQKTKEDNITDQFLKLSKESRNCIAILHDGNQTEILEAGPTFTKEEGEQYLTKFEELVQDVKIITLSGSLPPGLSVDFYKQLIEIAHKNDVKTLLDTSGDALKAVLESDVHPDLVKINLEELNAVSEEEVSVDFESMKVALESNLFADIEAVIITEGSGGAKAKWKNDFYDITIPTVEAVNPVGSGDSTLAGFAVGLEEGKSIEETLTLGMTFGVLNAMEGQTGFINMDHYDEIAKEVKVEKM